MTKRTAAPWALSLVLVLAGCGGAEAPSPASSPAAPAGSAAKPAATAAAVSASAKPAGGGTLTVGLSADLESGDSFLNYNVQSKSVILHLYDNLIEQDASGKLVPGLAESWKVVDPKTITFTLRKGVKFHNGEDFTAE